MIETKNACYFHMPKNGGTWLREVLAPVMISYSGHDIPEAIPKTNTFSIVRNPWHWYVSWYNFLTLGSDRWPPTLTNPAFKPFGRVPSFEEMTEEFCKPSLAYKKAAHAYSRLKLITDGNTELISRNTIDVSTSWVESDLSFYQFRMNTFLQVSKRVGKLENIKEELIDVTTEFGDYSEEVASLIESHPCVNFSKKVDYRSYYNEKLAELVYETHRPIIDRFGYEF